MLFFSRENSDVFEGLVNNALEPLLFLREQHKACGRN